MAAVSGGPDSLALLLVLEMISKLEGLSIGCCCVNHHLRACAADEARFVESVCKAHGIPFFLKDIDVQSFVKSGNSIETVARELRYQALREAALEGRYTKIAVAHHGNDQAETVLYHLLRGSGMVGLSGMKPVNGDIIRPLLCVLRKDIEGFLSCFPYKACHDESNDVQDAVRNRIRLSLMPVLESYNPRIADSLMRTTDILREENDFIEKEAECFVNTKGKSESARYSFMIADFLRLHDALKRRVIRRICQLVTGKIPGFDGIERFLHLIKNGRTGNFTSASGNMLHINYGQAVFFSGNTREKDVSHNQNAKIEFKDTGLKNADIINLMAYDDGQWGMESQVLSDRPIHLSKNQLLLDADKVGTVSLRFKRDGDSFQPKGVNGTKRLSRVMQDLHIPGPQRGKWPLIADDKNIYWIAFLRVSGYGIPDEGTKRYLLVTLEKEKVQRDEEFRKGH